MSFGLISTFYLIKLDKFFFVDGSVLFRFSLSGLIVAPFVVSSSLAEVIKDSYNFFFFIFLQFQYTKIPPTMTTKPIPANIKIIPEDPLAHFPSERLELDSHS